jgi:putative AlgH/UPF0301 family transcriptional regulator
MAKSIMQDKKECYICKTTIGLHRHHIYFGVANRSISEADGCVVYLCQRHHTGAAGVHVNRKIDLTLKARCELVWLEKNDATIEDFIKRYGRNYL